MNIISRTITGIIMIILGLFLIGFSFFETYWILIYGIPIFIIGILIFFNKKEDKIERIKFKREDKK
jgi:membrane-bound ClpP family serine protease